MVKNTLARTAYEHHTVDVRCTKYVLRSMKTNAIRIGIGDTRENGK